MSEALGRRASAAEAVEKIKGAMDLMNAWSTSDDTDDTLDSNISDYEDADQSRVITIKKRKITDFKPKPTQAARKRTVVVAKLSAIKKMENEKERKTSKFRCFSSKTKKVSKKIVAVKGADKDEATCQDKERRKAARQIHSNQPLRLSRQLTRRLSEKSLSPQFSPLVAEKLSFTPDATPLRSKKLLVDGLDRLHSKSAGNNKIQIGYHRRCPET